MNDFIKSLTGIEYLIYKKLEEGNIVAHHEMISENIYFGENERIDTSHDRRPAVHVSNINKKLSKFKVAKIIKNIRSRGYFLISW